jgi:hypothetical protein
MQAIWNFILSHQTAISVALYWICAGSVRSMPEPAANGSKFYAWFYGTVHFLAANFDKIGVAKAAIVTPKASSASV